MRLDHAITRVRNLVRNNNLERELVVEGLNLGWQEIAIRTHAIKKCFTCSIVKNQAIYRFPKTEYIIPFQAEIAKSESSYPLDPSPPNTLERSSVADADNTGSPQYYSVTSREGIFYVKLDPTPDADITHDPDNGIDDGLWFWCAKNHVPIFADTDEPELPETHQTGGLFYAAYIVSGEEKFLTLFERNLATLISYVPEIRVAVKERVKL